MKYENQSLCTKCQGQCCKKGPCFFMPEDFSDLSFAGLFKELQEKDYLCILYSVIPRISMRSKNWPKVVTASMTKGKNPCMVLTPTGCPYSYEDRPTGGKMLIPDPNLKECKSKLTLLDIDAAWVPYSDILEDLIWHFGKE